MGFWRLLAPGRQPAPPQEPPEPQGRVLVGLLALAFAALIASVDERLTTTGLTDMIGNFDYGRDEGSWLSSSYDAGNIAIVPMTPWLAQLLSLRRLAAFQIIVFTVGAVAVPLWRDYSWVIGCRFVQGFGEGALIPLMLLSILQHVPPHRRPDALCIYALVITCVPLFADSIEGVMTDLFTWRGLFYVTPALAPVAILGVLWGLPMQAPSWAKFRGADYFGLFCLVFVCVFISVGLTQGQRLDWFDSGLIDVVFLAAVFFLLAFILNEGFREKPLYEVSLFEKRNFALGLVIIVVFTTAVLGVNVLMPQFQTEIRGLRELQIGNITLWLLIPQLIMAPLTSWLLRRIDARLVLTVGLVLTGIGAWNCVWLTPVWDGNDFQPYIILQAAGWPLTIMAVTFKTSSALQKKDYLTGGAMFNIFRQLGTTLGSALVLAIVQVRERVHSDNDLISYLNPGRQVVLDRLMRQTPMDLYISQRQQATVLAYADAYGWLAIIAVGALVLVLLQAPTPVTLPPQPSGGD